MTSGYILACFFFARADEPGYSRNISDETSQQETLSEQTDSSEETTAGFIIDIWWSALREA